DAVDVVFAPSQAAVEVFARGLDVENQKVRIVPHPLPLWAYKRSGDRHQVSSDTVRSVDPPHAVPTLRTDDAQLRVGFIGYDAPQKGQRLLQAIVEACAAENITFISIGRVAKPEDFNGKLIGTGVYRREEVVDLIRGYRLDVMVIASPWPETYSYTLSEAWLAGAPVIVGPLGAPAERVAQTGAGLIAPDYRPESYVN